jgi:pseudouridine synthase
MRLRLQRALAQAGVASRREAEELVRRGDVTVNGSVARLGESADPEVDVIAVRGVPLPRRGRDRRYVAWHKPCGVVTTLRSTHGERTVRDFFPEGERLFPVGRLDKETSGLLLLTDDGDWANLVTHPRYGVEKEYLARLRGVPSADVLRRLERGVSLPDGTLTAPARVDWIGDDRGSARILITVIEGKKRQIRLMAAAVGHPVLDLRRTRVGPVRLGDLDEGEWRPLTESEVEGVREHARSGAGSRGP